MDVKVEEMMPVPIEDLVNGVKNPCALFVRLNEDKFVMVANADVTTDIEQLSNYHGKGIAYLWVYRKEYYKMVHQTTTLAGVIINRKDVAIERKTEFLSKAASSVLNQIDNLGLDLNTYGTARQVSEAVMSLVEHHQALAGLIESVKKSKDHLLCHSIAVSVFSTILGQAMGYGTKATLEKLSLGGLLHDIGLKAIPQELMKKSVIDMTPDEVQKWETHSYRGMQMLQALGIVPDDVVSIVYEHHENSIGQGYPRMIRDIKIHPLAKVVQLANQFAELTVPSPNNPNPKTARGALTYIEATMGMPFNKEVFRALRRIIDLEELKSA